MGQSERLVTRLRKAFFSLPYPQTRIFKKVLDTNNDHAYLSPTACNMSVVNDGLRDETHTDFQANLMPEHAEEQRFQVEMMHFEIEWLREQVRSLQDALAERIQQHQAIEQELQTIHQELQLMNQEIQRRMQTG